MINNFDFWDQFGHVGYLSCDIGLAYTPNGQEESFLLPENISEEEVEKLMAKSVADNHDYLKEIASSQKFTYKQDRLY